MKLGLLSAVTLVAMMMAASPAMAVHGQQYDAYGVATLGDQIFLAEVHWSGYWGQTFTVEIKTTDGVLVATESFLGYWQASGPVWYAFEILAYHGWARDGSAHFDVVGVQFQQVAGGGPDRVIMYYEGNFWDYALQLVVPGGVDPW